MKHLPVVIALLVAVLAFMPAAKPVVGPVATVMSKASRSDRAKLRSIYTSLADKTKQDNGALISTVGMWRQLHSNTLKLAAAEMKGKYDGLDVAVEKVLADAFPLDDVGMSGQLVDKIAAGCMEVAKQSE